MFSGKCIPALSIHSNVVQKSQTGNVCINFYINYNQGYKNDSATSVNSEGE